MLLPFPCIQEDDDSITKASQTDKRMNTEKKPVGILLSLLRVVLTLDVT